MCPSTFSCWKRVKSGTACIVDHLVLFYNTKILLHISQFPAFQICLGSNKSKEKHTPYRNLWENFRNLYAKPFVYKKPIVFKNITSVCIANALPFLGSSYCFLHDVGEFFIKNSNPTAQTMRQTFTPCGRRRE